MTNPPVNWGYAREVGGFFHVITRGQYERLNPTENLGKLVEQVWMYGGIAVTQFGAVYLLVALVPFWFLRRMQAHDRKVMLGLVAIFLCMSLFMLILLNPPPDRAARELLEQYFLASYLMPALWTGYGLLLLGTLLVPRLVIDPVPQEPARPGERELGPAIGMQVSDKVVHTSGARHCTYGRRRSRRGAGRPQWFAQSAREN